MSSEGSSPGYARVMRNSRFRAVFLAGVTSQSGGTIANVAILWIVFATTHSALMVAYVGIAQLLATVVFTLPAGAWVDRYSRTRLMISADLARAVLMGGLALSFVLVGFSIFVVLAVVFALNIASVVFQPAENTLIPTIVPKVDLADANGLYNSSGSVVNLISSSIGGVLVVTVGAAFSLFYNTFTYVISATLLYTVYLSLRAAEQEKQLRSNKGEKKMGREIAEGIKWLIRESPGLWQLSISALFMNFFNIIFYAFTVVYVVESLHGTALTFGLFLAALTAGSAAGNLLVGRTKAVQHVGKVWILVYGVSTGLALTAFAFTTDIWVAFPLAIAISFASGFGGNTWLTAAQLLVPTEVQGRYFAFDGLMSYGVLPVSEIIGGILITLHGVSFAFEIAGIGLLGSSLLSILGRDLWKLQASPAVA